MPASVNELDPKEILKNFESLGDNCEFGFVQRKSGIEDGQLLRWAFVPTAGLIAGLRAEFADLYEFENLIPAAPNMVWDERYHIAFHSGMRSETRDGKLMFVAPESERRIIHRDEADKISHLRNKFLESARSGGTIYTLKTNAGVDLAQVKVVYDLVRGLGDNALLAVAPASDSFRAGEVVTHEDGFRIAYIDRFAPYARADDISLETWLKICKSAKSEAI